MSQLIQLKSLTSADCGNKSTQCHRIAVEPFGIGCSDRQSDATVLGNLGWEATEVTKQPRYDSLHRNTHRERRSMLPRDYEII